MTKILLVCVGNAGRSQMAQAFLERSGIETRSAGTRPERELHPNVVEVMLEVGVDLSGREPRELTREDVDWADLVVTMGCGDECPVLPGKDYRDWPLEDPMGRSLEETRAIRDEIARRVAGLASEIRIDRSGNRRPGFAERYHTVRPKPPEALVDLLCRYAGVERRRLVVDFGSGTGLSTEAWAPRADEVVGVELSPEMRAVAEAHASANVRYLAAHAADTGLQAGTADIVTASQSLHWMEPEPTFAEAARILRKGGVFAAYDHEWPPAVHPDVDAAWERVMDILGVLDPPWKLEHAARMRSSGHFRYVREVLLHGVEEGGAERIEGLVLALGPIVRRLEEGATEEELGLTELQAVARRVLGDRSAPWLFSYRMRIGVR